MTAETVVNLKPRIGEGPLWHPDRDALYWIDVPTGDLYRYDPATDGNELLHSAGEPLGGYTFQADGSLLLFGAGRVVRWADGETETLVDGIPDGAGTRFNDVIADPKGRVFAGTMDDDDHSVGRLDRLDRDGSLVEMCSGVELPNGMGFDPDGETFYLAESNTDTIYAFAYDRSTGAIGDRRTFASGDGPGMYDGLTVDRDGRVWSARWGEGVVVKHDEDGAIERRIELPSVNVTSLAFGGPAFDRAYVTSATYEAPLSDVTAGAVYRIDPGTRGRPPHYSRVLTE